MLALLVVLIAAPPLPEGAIAALGSPRFRVDGEIAGFCVSPDESLIAADANNGVVVFDAATGSVVRRFADFTFCGRVSFLASGDLCVVGDSDDGTELIVSDPRTGVERRRVRFAGVLPGSVDVSPDGLLLASDNDAGEVVELYSAVTGRKLAPVRFRKGDSIGSALFSPCGRFLIGTSPHGWVYAFDRATGAALSRHRVPNPQTVRFSPDGQYLAVCGGPNGDEIAVFDLPGVRHVGTVTSSPSANWVAFGPKNVLTVGTDLWTDRYDPAAKMKKLPPLPRTRLTVYDAHIGRDGTTITANTGHGSLIRWSAATGEPRPESPVVFGGFDENRIAFAGPGRVLAHANEQGWLAFDTRTGRMTATAGIDWMASALSPDETLLAVETGTAVELRAAKTGKVRKSFPHTDDETIGDLKFTADGKHLVGRLGDSMLRVWDVAAGTSLDINPSGGRPVAAYAVAAGTVAVAVPDRDDADGVEVRYAVKRFRLDGSPIGPDMGLPMLPETLLLSADGRVLAAVGSGSEGRDATVVSAHDTATGKQHFARQLGVRPQAAALTSDGRGFLVSQLGTLLALETYTGQERFRRSAKGDVPLSGVAVSPDGRTAATTGGAIPVLLWDLKAVPKPPDVSTAGLRRDLAADAATAYRAQCYLETQPAITAAVFRELPLPPRPDESQVRRWAAELDARDFRTRRAAKAELLKHADSAGPLLEVLRKETTSAERRAALTAVIEARDRMTPDKLRRLRLADVLAALKSANP